MTVALTIEDVGPIKFRRAVRAKNLVRSERLSQSRPFRFTPEQDAFIRRHYDRNVRGRAQVIGDRLRLPKWRITHRASQLGLSRVKEKPWSEYEVRKLQSQIGFTSIAKLAKRLGRSETAIQLKATRLGIQKRRHGYTATSLSQALGVNNKFVTGRIADGRIHAIRRETRRTDKQGGDEWLITDEDVIEYIRANPYDLDIKKIDAYWFMDVITAHLQPTPANVERQRERDRRRQEVAADVARGLPVDEVAARNDVSRRTVYRQKAVATTT